jgi:hypothetical protein
MKTLSRSIMFLLIIASFIKTVRRAPCSCFATIPADAKNDLLHTKTGNSFLGKGFRSDLIIVFLPKQHRRAFSVIVDAKITFSSFLFGQPKKNMYF